MSKKLKNDFSPLRGILSNVSGSFDNIVLTKKGVIYFKDNSKRKKKSKT
jgi:hypothetical protein